MRPPPFFAFLLAAGACTSEPSVRVAAVRIESTWPGLIVDSTVTLTTSLIDADSNAVTGRPVHWTSFQPSVATVSDAGVVRGISPGFASIEARVDGAADTTLIIVVPHVGSLTVWRDTGSTLTGDTLWVGALPRDSNGAIIDYLRPTWVSRDSTRAVVSAEGAVRGVRPGNVWVVAALGPFRDSVAVRVMARVATFSLDPDTLVVTVGGTGQIAAEMRDSAGNALTDRTPQWLAGGPAALTVSATGIVTGVTGGNGTVVATIEGRADTVIVQVRTAGAFIAVASGDQHSCAATDTGRTYCWGYGGYGELGTGGMSSSSRPTLVTGAPPFVELASEVAHVCGRTSANVVWCWGAMTMGQTGNMSGPQWCQYGTPCRGIPLPITDTLRYVHIAAGTVNTCGITAGQEAWCFGGNGLGALGAGSSDTLPHPAALQVSGGHAWSRLTGSSYGGCGLTTAGAAWCWGAGDYGRLGDGSSGTVATIPVPVSGGHVLTAIESREWRTCAVDQAGQVWCWGGGSAVPAPVAGAAPFTAVTIGDQHVCGIGTDSLAYCWGDNTFGQLGNGMAGGSSAAPVPVSGGLKFSALASGTWHTCGIAAGRLYCWGEGSAGELGSGTGNRSVPTPIDGQP